MLSVTGAITGNGAGSIRVARKYAAGSIGVAAAGLEGDVIKLTADILTTSPDGLIRARLPFNNVQGSLASIPGLTLVLSSAAQLSGTGFGTPESNTWIQIQVGGVDGGFITARPKLFSGK